MLTRRRPNLPGRTVTAAVVAVALVAGATWTVTDVGRSGAKTTWDDVGADDDG